MIKLTTLYSGSSGNATLLEASSAGIRLLIDAGRSARYTEKALLTHGLGLLSIAAVFITHEHSDHIGGVEMMMKRTGGRVALHVTEESADRFIRRGSYAADAVELHKPLYRVTLGGLNVSSFTAEHDSAMNVGYVFEDADGDRAGVVTDLGCVTAGVLTALSGCRSVVVESNHDVELLMSGAYPEILKRRILSRRGHLCNDDCAALAVRLADSGAENITLAHLSDENNRPSLAVAATCTALERAGYGGVRVTAAPRDAF